MQPIKLSILGDFWDTHIYRGRLYLWDLENNVRVFDWSKFIDDIAHSTGNHFLVWAFARGDELYQEFLKGPLFRDREVRDLVHSKLQAASELELEFSLEELEPYRMGVQASPFVDLHDDLALYRNAAYALTEKGLFVAKIHKPRKNKYKLGRKSEKIWSGRGINLAANRTGLAIAAASDGLFEYIVWENGEPEQVAKGHASFPNWLFASIYASSSMAEGYLAAFRWVKEDEDLDIATRWRREPAGIFEENEIFGGPSEDQNGLNLTWGSQEKVYKAGPDRITAIRFTQKHIGSDSFSETPFEPIGEMSLTEKNSSFGSPISAGVSFFGNIVEYPNCITIVESDSTIHRIEGTATRWRVFPRSHWYPNHLHVVLQDRVEILSINGDLFTEQRSKISGIEFRKQMLGEI